MPQKPKETKICLVCKRPFENRKSFKLRGIWDEVKYCSKGCRKRRNSKLGQLQGKT